MVPIANDSGQTVQQLQRQLDAERERNHKVVGNSTSTTVGDRTTTHSFSINSYSQQSGYQYETNSTLFLIGSLIQTITEYPTAGASGSGAGGTTGGTMDTVIGVSNSVIVGAFDPSRNLHLQNTQGTNQKIFSRIGSNYSRGIDGALNVAYSDAGFVREFGFENETGDLVIGATLVAAGPFGVGNSQSRSAGYGSGGNSGSYGQGNSGQGNATVGSSGSSGPITTSFKYDYGRTVNGYGKTTHGDKFESTLMTETTQVQSSSYQRHSSRVEERNSQSNDTLTESNGVVEYKRTRTNLLVTGSQPQIMGWSISHFLTVRGNSRRLARFIAGPCCSESSRLIESLFTSILDKFVRTFCEQILQWHACRCRLACDDDVAFGREGLHPQIERDTTPTAPERPTTNTAPSNPAYTPPDPDQPNPTSPPQPPKTNAEKLLDNLKGFERDALESDDEDDDDEDEELTPTEMMNQPWDPGLFLRILAPKTMTTVTKNWMLQLGLAL